MKPKEFPQVNIRIAETQDEYITLPAYFDKRDRTVSFCMVMTPEQLAQANKSGGEIWIRQHMPEDGYPPLIMDTDPKHVLSTCPVTNKICCTEACFERCDVITELNDDHLIALEYYKHFHDSEEVYRRWNEDYDEEEIPNPDDALKHLFESLRQAFLDQFKIEDLSTVEVDFIAIFEKVYPAITWK